MASSRMVDQMQLDPCNFNVPEFDEIWIIPTNYVSALWNVDQGRETNLSWKEMLFISMRVLKHGKQWAFTAKLFKMSYCCIERQENKYLQLISSLTFEKFVLQAMKMWTMHILRNIARTFKHFDHTWNATNVTFQPTNRPSRKYGWRKEVFLEILSSMDMRRRYWF